MKPSAVPLLGTLPLIILWGLPLAGGLAAFAASAADGAAWNSLLRHPQLAGALLLSLWTGTAGLLLAILAAITITMGYYGTPAWRRLQAAAAASLALPHLAFAIGFGFLIMPSGLLARVIAGGTEPPSWVTTQDPMGIALIAVLALKETPFLLAILWSLLARGDVAAALGGQWRAARSLGHGTASVWLRVLLPQLLARMKWPLLIVWVYGATVVDMALVIGPAQPPTLAVLVWADLNNAAAVINARGAAGATLLTLVLAGLATAAAALALPLRAALHRFMSAGPSLVTAQQWPATLLTAFVALTYGLVVMTLTLMSMAGHWPYPALVPELFRLSAWRQLAADAAPLILSLSLALATSATAVTLAVAWFETMDERFDRWLTGLAVAALGLPALAIAGGQYRIFLILGLDGTLPGLFLAHLTAVFAYAVLVLREPYRGFDRRFRAAAHGLNAGHWRFWHAVKLPLLKAPLLTAGAIGFSVSMAQFVPAQLIAAGRFSTLPMEAVTRASGGDRTLTAAFALALALGPAIVFLLAAWAARPRWSQPWS